MEDAGPKSAKSWVNGGHSDGTTSTSMCLGYLLTAAKRAKKVRQVITSTKMAKGEALIFGSSFPLRAS
jgi:hypothetical protein